MVWNFFEFWLFPGNQSYCVLLVLKLFLWSSFRKSYSICLENSDMASFWPFKAKIWPFSGQNWLFWEFLADNFQTRLWIFHIFGMELVWIWLSPGNQSYCVLVLIDIKVPNIVPQIVLDHKNVVRKFKFTYMASYNMKCKGWYFLIWPQVRFSWKNVFWA